MDRSLSYELYFFWDLIVIHDFKYNQKLSQTER